MIEVSYRRLKMLVPNTLSKLFDFAQNLYVGYSQVQRNTFLSKSDLRVLTLTVPNPGSLRASCYQSHLRKKLDIRSIKRLLLLNLARCINYIMIGDSSSIHSPVLQKQNLIADGIVTASLSLPNPPKAEIGDTRDDVVLGCYLVAIDYCTGCTDSTPRRG